jgi:hypothetical protein
MLINSFNERRGGGIYLNDKKICFIYCVNDQLQLQKSVEKIYTLKVPSGYQIEHISIEHATSMTSGYNSGMQKTNAKYKVYLHQDVLIVNPNFLIDIVYLFEKYPKLGILGVIGTKALPENAVWWHGDEKFGKVHESSPGTMRFLSFAEVTGDYESVQAIDGLIMITQYDIPWREDIFKTWHFYDISQCFEFSKAGYEVGIPNQDEAWVIHDCGIVNVTGYDKERETFIQHYGKDFIV